MGAANYRQRISFSDQFDPKLMIAAELLQMNKPIASGNFGAVYRAHLTGADGSSEIVAVKTVRDIKAKQHKDDARLTLMKKEGLSMRKLKHKNVISLKGITYVDKSFGLVLEWMENGDLLTYIRSKPTTLKQRVSFFADIVAGMEYLADRKIYHRDLAARNILLDERLSAKVADFGLSYETPENSGSVGHVSRATSMIQKVAQPIWWMSPECIEKRFYDEKTDVWSFAVLMWEVMSGGDCPYKHYRWKGEQRYIWELKRGIRPNQIVGCPTVLVKTMSLCWTIIPSERPKFSTLREGFNEMLNR